MRDMQKQSLAHAEAREYSFQQHRCTALAVTRQAASWLGPAMLAQLEPRMARLGEC